MTGTSSFGHRAKAKVVSYGGIYSSLSEEARNSFTEKANHAQEHPETKEALRKEYLKAKREQQAIAQTQTQPLKRAKEDSVIRTLNQRVREEQAQKKEETIADAFMHFIHELFDDDKEAKDAKKANKKG